MKQKVFFLIFTFLVVLSGMRPRSVWAEFPPQFFCLGVEPWVIPTLSPLPDDPVCGVGTGTYIVDKEGSLTQFIDWQDARAGMGDSEGTFWYEPTVQQPPTFYCLGGDPWIIPFNSLLPDDPVCPEISGEYVMDVQGDISRHMDWFEAKDHMGMHEGTFWFERILQNPPDGFCQGSMPWQVTGNSLLPDFSVCNQDSGTYVVDIQGDLSRFNFWPDARQNLGSNEGTFWFEVN